MMFEGLGSVSWLPIAVFVLANENRTQDAGHALLRQGWNPKVRKNSGVILLGDASEYLGHNFYFAFRGVADSNVLNGFLQALN